MLLLLLLQVDRKYSHLNAFAMWHIFFCHFILLNTFERARYAIACINLAVVTDVGNGSVYSQYIGFSCKLCERFGFCFLLSFKFIRMHLMAIKWLVCSIFFTSMKASGRCCFSFCQSSFFPRFSPLILQEQSKLLVVWNYKMIQRRRRRRRQRRTCKSIRH